MPACEGNHTPLGRGRRGSIYWRPIDKSEDLEKLIEELPSKPFLVGDEGVSMSLAGVQTKLAVAVDQYCSLLRDPSVPASVALAVL